MKYYLGVTDNNWYNFLSRLNPEDINFWQPGGLAKLSVLSRGTPFLFKLKAPVNAIGGVGFVSSHIGLPLSMAWDTFGIRNGCKDFDDLIRSIRNYRKDKSVVNPFIGCIVLTDPIFFEQQDWIPVPTDWSNPIVQGKSYDSNDQIGGLLWDKVLALLDKYMSVRSEESNKSPLFITEPEGPMYSNSILQKVRIGQGAFRVLVTDVYSNKCSVTGEKTLPVLDAAHIKPYALSGPHATSNGILLRTDLHKLLDGGYLTLTKDFKIEVSKRIKEEFQNGKEYYQFHGKELLNLPERNYDRPNETYIDWHNTNIFRG